MLIDDKLRVLPRNRITHDVVSIALVVAITPHGHRVHNALHSSGFRRVERLTYAGVVRRQLRGCICSHRARQHNSEVLGLACLEHNAVRDQVAAILTCFDTRAVNLQLSELGALTQDRLVEHLRGSSLDLACIGHGDFIGAGKHKGILTSIPGQLWFGTVSFLLHRELRHANFVTCGISGFLRTWNRRLDHSVDEALRRTIGSATFTTLTKLRPIEVFSDILRGYDQTNRNLNGLAINDYATRDSELWFFFSTEVIGRSVETLSIFVSLRLTSRIQLTVFHTDDLEALVVLRKVTDRRVLASNIAVVSHPNGVRQFERFVAIALGSRQIDRIWVSDLVDCDIRIRQFNTRRVNCRFTAHHRWIVRQNAVLYRQARHTTLVTNLILFLGRDTESHRRLIVRRNHTTEQIHVVSKLVALNRGAVDVTDLLIWEDTVLVRHVVPVQRRRFWNIRYRFSIQLIVECHRCSGHVTRIPHSDGVLKLRDTLLGLKQLHRLLNSEIALRLGTRS